MSDKIIKENFEKQNFLIIKIDKNLDLNHTLTLLKNSVRFIPLYGGGLTMDGNYEIAIIFESKFVKIDKWSKTIEVNKLEK